jgi:hypothetical protein
MADRALLVCGIIAPLVYLTADVVAGLRWDGYSFRDQTISELNALGAPTRRLTISLGLAGYSFLLAFGVGVWRSASRNRALRLAGWLMVGFSLLALWAVPFASMHVREAEESFSDTLHIVEGAIAICILLTIIGLATSTFGMRYRLYSVATVLVLLGFGGWTAMDGARLADNLSTPWLGIKERISVYAYQLWLVVFAVAVLRRQVEGEGRHH